MCETQPSGGELVYEAEPAGGEIMCEVEPVGEGRVFSVLSSPASPTMFMCEVEACEFYVPLYLYLV